MNVTIIQGDAMEELAKLAPESVHCCVTSPPYWGLRNYGIPPRSWGGVEGCIHDWQPSGFCICGAWRGVLGLEPTPELFVAHLVSVFDQVRRVLRSDGTCWVNLGDSYQGSGNTGGVAAVAGTMSHRGKTNGKKVNAPGLKAGDLVGIPWRFALAMQAAGWWLRRDVIWSKPNPMPEAMQGVRFERHRIKVSSRAPRKGKYNGMNGQPPQGDDRGNKPENAAQFIDCPGCKKCDPNGGLILRRANWRPTTAHEYIFQFAKSDSYFCDATAAQERTTGGAHARGNGVNPKAKRANSKHERQNESFSGAVSGLVAERNLRSVWRIATHPYKGAHCATFPPKLIEPIIRAATSPHVCGQCGAPWAPVIERGAPDLAWQRQCGGDKNGHYNGEATKDYALNRAENPSAVKARILAGMVRKRVSHYLATCRCGAYPVPATILDPFLGAGTTAMVSRQLGRNCIGIELSPDYVALATERADITGGLRL